MRTDMAFNIDNYVEKEPMSGCWLWTKALNKFGYGIKSGTLAHRYVYKTIYKDSFVESLDVMHLCHNRCCVNPSHLKQGTRKENVAMSVKVGHWATPARSKARKSFMQSNLVNGFFVGKSGKFSNKEILDIRKQKEAGVASKELALLYNVTQQAINSIYKRKVYRHVL